ncbi:MAG: flagellar protein FliS [Planctomycetes bacterium]|nr:flagellar protein FliS [Planctomycetota bacterium]
MQSKIASVYLASEAASIPPLKLVRMVNSGASSSLALALEHLRSGERAKFVKQVNKSQNLIAELHMALNFEEGKQIARQLDRLYEWAQRTLTDSCLKADPKGVEAVIHVLNTLQEGWDGIRDEREQFACA